MAAYKDPNLTSLKVSAALSSKTGVNLTKGYLLMTSSAILLNSS